LNIENDLDGIKMKQRAKYLGQRSFRSKIIVRTDRHANDRMLDLDY